MSDRISVWGIGFKFTALSLGYSFAIIFINYFTYPLFYIKFLEYRIFLISGIVLIVLGLPLFIISGFSVHRAYAEDVLRTRGVYSICRHPLYASFIFFIVPGICLLFKSWIAFSVPFVMYVFFRILIKEEEDYLSKRFSSEYEKYKRKVLLAFPRIWRYEK
ncbi:isoprenylcysteine carboxylmethyltransferase family protein [candidate division WOR-3 bacterium]|nr:isoprenylcysteine carboxylmethyltransferase family protein [candidate division WOR-3 bacterium]